MDAVWPLHSSLCTLVGRRNNELMISNKFRLSACLLSFAGDITAGRVTSTPYQTRPNSTPRRNIGAPPLKVEDSCCRAIGHHPDKFGRVGGTTGLIGITWRRRGRFSYTYIQIYTLLLSRPPSVPHSLSRTIPRKLCPSLPWFWNLNITILPDRTCQVVSDVFFPQRVGYVGRVVVRLPVAVYLLKGGGVAYVRFLFYVIKTNGNRV